MNRLPKSLAVLLIAATLAPSAFAADAPATSPAAAPDLSAMEPKPMIQKVVADVLSALRDPKNSKLERRMKVQASAEPFIDFETMARLAMGRPWRTLTDQQKADYVKEFHQHLANTYGHTTDEYTDEDVAITGDRTEDNKDVIVQTTITGTRNGGPRQQVAKVDYRLRKGTNGWRIIDVDIDGISLVSNFRSQFTEIMNNGGYDRMMQLLREKNAEKAKE